MFNVDPGPWAAFDARRWESGLWERLHDDALIYGLIATYGVATAALAIALGLPNLDNMADDLWLWFRSGFFALAAYLAVRAGWETLRGRPARPLGFMARRLRALATPRVVAGLCLYMALGVFMGAFSLSKSLLPRINPFHFDPFLSGLGRIVFFGHTGWELLQPALGHHWVTRSIAFLYHVVWPALLAAIPFYMAVFCRDRALRRRFLVANVLAWIVLGTVMAGVFMSGGPIFYGQITGDYDRYRAMIDYLSFDRGQPFSAIDIRDYLWSMHQAGVADFGSGISDLPSLHVTMSYLWAATAFKLNRRLGWAVAVFAGVIYLGSVHLGWHYATGGLITMAAAALLWWFGGKLTNPHAHHWRPTILQGESEEAPQPAAA